MSSPGQNDSNPQTGSGYTDDRRVHHSLRPVFDQACRITAPFFDPEQGWGGKSLTMYARQALRETFPELSQQEIAILFSAVQRFHQTKASQ